jgi:hypothetical protein
MGMDGEPTPGPTGQTAGPLVAGIQVVRTSISLRGLEEMAASMFGNLVKVVVDVERGVMAVGGEMDDDEEALPEPGQPHAVGR